MDDRQALLVLNAVGGLGAKRIRCLLDAFNTAGNVFLRSHNELSSVRGIGPLLARAILSFDRQSFLDVEMKGMASRGVDYLTWEDQDYPFLLKQISDPPPVLYIKGRRQAYDRPCIAIVGSRRASLQGLNVARDMAYGLAQRGFCVISGMARGIDTAAHQGSLDAGGETIAVLGNGLNDPYPQDNHKLFERIADQGAVLSEFPLSAKPLAAHFPRRNRIVSGLCWGVLVVEARERSGALITAHLALDQDREVFAVPGPIGKMTSVGTNSLIKNGACLLTSADDIVEEFSHRLTAYYAEGAQR